MTKTNKSIFPYDQTLIQEYPLITREEIGKKLKTSGKAYEHWRNLPFNKRAEILLKAGQILKEKSGELATLITNEMGKVKKEAVGEVEKCAWVCEYYAQNAERILKDKVVDAGLNQSFIAYEPIGTVMAVMPWNFPFWQVFRFAAPTLMAGNTGMLKHASNVMGCGNAIQQVLLEAGAPDGLFQHVIVGVEDLEYIVADNAIKAVTLTGSEKAGASFASLAAKNIKKPVLELGGSDAFIVCADADIKKAAEVAVQSRMQNAGQSCIAAKRFIVVQNVLDQFINEVTSIIEKLHQGNPFDANVTTGPMARIDLAETLNEQMKNSIKKGAKLIVGGEMNGANFSPALVTQITEDMPAFCEETFGPLAPIIGVKNEVEAISMANKSSFGLGSSIWTTDTDKGISLARKIEAGSVYINSMMKSDPRFPFGGIKRSGFGRELGNEGMMEFVNIKTIVAE